jgi:tetratricopeptide (TPR) repeat protein
MTRFAAPLLIIFGVLVGLSVRTVVNCGDADDPDICAAVIGFSPLRGSLIAFAYEGRGRIAMRHGDAKMAIADFDEAIRLNPNRAAVFRDRGLARQRTGALDGAIADYDQAIALDPKLAAPYANRGIALAARGDLDRAILSYTTAIRLAPSDAESRVNRGLALAMQGRSIEARADFEAALSLPDGKDGWAHSTARTRLADLADDKPN